MTEGKHSTVSVDESELASIAQVLNARRMSEADLQAMLGGCPEKFKAVTAELRKRVLAKRFKIPSLPDFYLKGVEPIIAACPWTREQVLAHIKDNPCTSSALAVAARCSLESMQLLLRRMQAERLIKITSIRGKGNRRWVPMSHFVPNGGERKPVRTAYLLALIRLHQPARLELLAELTGRGRIYLRELVHKLRREGKLKIIGVDGSWRYALPDYERSPADVGQAILLRCEDVGGDCLKWEGAHNAQGHALVRHNGNVQRVDKVLWTVVHGKRLFKGHTLVNTCETPGCCQHEHHKATTRSAAMKKAFAAIGFGGEAHGRRVAAAVRGKTGSLSPEDVQLIRTSPLSGAALARQLGKSKNAINNVRSGRAYRDYSNVNQPATVMGQLMGAVCR